VTEALACRRNMEAFVLDYDDEPFNSESFFGGGFSFSQD
jgi:hypothetical protein